MRQIFIELEMTVSKTLVFITKYDMHQLFWNYFCNNTLKDASLSFPPSPHKNRKGK